MDWSKAKTILIVIFFGLNIFLMYNLFDKETKPITISEQDVSNIKSILSQNNIELKATLKNKISPKSALIIQNISYDEQELLNKLFKDYKSPIKIEKLDQKTVYSLGEGSKILEIYSNKRIVYKDNNPSDNIEGLSKNEIIRYVEKFLKDNNLYPANTKLKEYKSKNGQYFIGYKESYKSNEIFASYINLKLTNKGVTQIDKYWVNPVQFDKESNDIIKTPIEILLIFAKDFGGANKIIIDEVSEGYYFPPKNYSNASFTATPTWKIKTNSGEIYYYNGYEGYLENAIKSED